MKIMLTGADGQLASCFKKNFPDNIKAHYFSKKELDITNYNDLEEVFSSIEPDFVLNCAAYTNVNNANIDKKTAYQVNALGPKNLAKLCRKSNAILIHFSTDYVFDGKKSEGYSEIDECEPLNYYGLSKREGELQVIKSGCKYLIFRTSWVFSEFGKNFFKSIVAKVLDKQDISVVSDQYGNPTYAGDIANTVISIINNIQEHQLNNIYHLAGKPFCSWYDFSKKIIENANEKFELSTQSPKKILTKSSKNLVERPKNTCMNTKKIETTFKINSLLWEVAVKKIIEDIY